MDQNLAYQVYFYNEPKLTMDYKILDACRQYFLKTKHAANQVLINPEDFQDVIGDYALNTPEHKSVKNILVMPDIAVLKGHIYVRECSE